ncbi:2-keto-4-pentenoate hydratase [Lentibacillus persicus]|uniref:2-keto-4-pentenoate hydratase n=1 Tax=Lentibacillus persicus TaxID=640948 RepID=A0A1I2AWF9_9BACI|nr:2-keto-4-pentenoate hydratase [Lentibacillus persicus]SFE48057.1 2-keto-4-pentenoate hydratase [Lentibacillus persicus]
MNIHQAASTLLEAESDRKSIERFTSSAEAISVDEAYQIQLEIVRRKREKGAAVIGKKIGLTSQAMQEMLGVDKPDYGHLLDNMVFEEDTVISLDQFIQPKVEFEIAFVLHHDLQGPGVTVTDVINATDYVTPAIEVIDSRIKDWQIQFEDTVADNGSSAGAVFGNAQQALSDIDLPATEMTVYKNGTFLDRADGSAVMDNPVNAVVWLANALGEYGISLKKGEKILAGALSKAVPVEDGDSFEAAFEKLGTVKASFQKKDE